jgi:glycosyltransferase involved in cell wall biosynthesis
MKFKPTVSIIISNYNYDRFLAEAIDSALNQTYPSVEVVVVDDGSTDRSHAIISSYDRRIIPVLKQNGGQASALNAGVEVSRGEIIFFLDADDIFFATKVEEMVNFFNKLVQEDPDVLISNYIETINESGILINIDILEKLSATSDWRHLREIRGYKKQLIDGEITKLSTSEQVYQFAGKYRFIPYLAMPTSGFAMTRSLANKVFPIPCESFKISADDFIVKGASVVGSVYLTNKVLTKYRIHGNNSWYGCISKIPKEFFEVLDIFLNSKLKTTGRKPVFSYFNSTHAKGYYRIHYPNNCDRELFELAIEVIAWHINLKTIIFFVKTIVLSIFLKVKRISNDFINLLYASKST